MYAGEGLTSIVTLALLDYHPTSALLQVSFKLSLSAMLGVSCFRLTSCPYLGHDDVLAQCAQDLFHWGTRLVTRVAVVCCVLLVKCALYGLT